ncbi:TetR/AcrR family transcriptional regulator [Mycobacterium sp. Y57]|uniref:TetR/AcrR family transcriptional regulator n=1 Tax=Mycolicibacterium xanthum TaxID=2796469 RepID=UPI001C8527B6|nr:TetR/AcrR family transcriptional regulator [Mycolicibacterium xanthum]MBX7433384.1 TetR/AcrR family transcriptional regulator [Mycolicibacterium xanthum]
MSTLSGSFPKSAPGLPRGRTRLDPLDATAHQRARLQRAVVAAVAEKGYQATTIADIVQRARVSRSVMYREFDGKLDCFLAAIEGGRELVVARISHAMDEVSGGSLETVLRAIIRAYLETCAAEPDHTRAWVLELAAAGPAGVRARDRYLDGFAALLSEIDRDYGSGRARPIEYYIALVGGITELVGREVRAGAESSLPRLEDALTMVAVAMLR